MTCESCFLQDINSDGIQEICIRYHFNFADRTSVASIFLMKQKGKWVIISPDFEDIEEEIRDQLDDNSFVLIDSFLFNNPKAIDENDLIYSLGMYGDIIRVENPLWGGYSYLYYLAVNNGTSVLSTNYCALAMMRFSKDNKFERDPSWNSREILVGPCEQFDILQVIEEKWGIQSGDIVFYRI